VAALKEKLGRARLQSVQEKAELETLNRFAAARMAQLNATDLAGDAQVSRWSVWPVWSRPHLRAAITWPFPSPESIVCFLAR